MGRLLGQRRAPRRGRPAVGCAVPQLVVPLPALDARQLALQLLVALLLGADLLGDLVAIRGVQLVDELRNEVRVLQRLLDRGQRGTGLLPLAWVAIAGGVVAVIALLEVDLAPQPLEIEVAQGIRAETAALEVPVASDIGVLLQQVRDPAEDGSAYAIGVQALEQEQRLEGGVGRAASIHPPVPLGVRGARRAMGRGLRKGSQRDGTADGGSRGAGGHRTAADDGRGRAGEGDGAVARW
jgi:hypothetical protein